MKFVVAKFARGAWAWLRIEDKLTLGQGAEAVTRDASSITYELQDQPGRATVFKVRADANAAALTVSGIVVVSTWRPRAVTISKGTT